MYNDFEKMCKDLSEVKRCGCPMCVASNEYVCAYNMVKAYAEGNKNKLLKLKAQAEAGDYNAFFEKIFALLSFFIASSALIITIAFEICKENKSFIVIYGLMILIAFVIFFTYIRFKIKKFEDVPKWRDYIRIAIEELQKEVPFNSNKSESPS